jgi:creatinine amidohydrolase
MFPDELEAAFSRKPAVYFTYGPCEPHGPQNALGLDGLTARAVAIRTAQEHGGIVAPADYWHIHELGEYGIWGASAIGEVPRKWLTPVPPWVFFKNVVYQIRAAEQIGFEATVLLTGHGGPHSDDLKQIVDLIQPYVRTRLMGLTAWEINLPGYDNDGHSGGDHAGRVETSLLWALEPDCVDPSRMPQGESGSDHFTTEPYFAMGPDARESDRRIGERMVADEVRELAAITEGSLAAYKEAADQSTETDASRPGLETFEAVEVFWDSVVRPRMADFASMLPEGRFGGSVPRGSVWERNWTVTDRS